MPHNASAAEVRYFAFGANMARSVLVGRRGIEPIASTAARLDGYALRFVLRGLPWLEPAFASMVEAPGESMFGVLHTLTSWDMARLDSLERSYERIAITVVTDTGPVAATAYRARRPSVERAPSRRYLRLLVEGASEHGLPEAWLDSLRARHGTHVRGVSPMVEKVMVAGERTLLRLRPPPR
jgi:gamma-glutamylcyclotransferase